jgi:hypothetical protein
MSAPTWILSEPRDAEPRSSRARAQLHAEPDARRRPRHHQRPVCPTILAFSGLLPSASEEQVRCNAWFGSSPSQASTLASSGKKVKPSTTDGTSSDVTSSTSSTKTRGGSL